MLKWFRRKADFREKCRRWVVDNLGAEWEQEFLQKYDDLNNGIPIGGLEETMVFLDMIERIRSESSGRLYRQRQGDKSHRGFAGLL